MRTFLATLVVLTVSVAAQGAVLLTGAGATFPTPLYTKWFDTFHQREPDIAVNYQSVGSGAGIASITQGTVDFGAMVQ